MSRTAAVLLMLFIWARAVNATVTVSPWTPLFKGIDFATGRADTNEPVLQEVKALRIDLADPDISFFSTPSNGTNDLETFGQKTSTFLTTYGLQVAVNANFFSPCCATTPNEPKDLLGLAMSQGEVVSPQVTSGTGSRVLLLTRSNQASIVTTSPAINTDAYYTAVAGSAILVVNGVNQGAVDTLNPRTAVGISQNKRYLYLITIDGRQPGYSDGATLKDTAEWLIRFGSYSGLNLDGGGSTAMVRRQGNSSVLLNKPSGGVERIDGNNIGVFALPLALSITNQPRSQTVYYGQDVTFNVGAIGAGPISFQWRFKGTNITGATQSSYTLTNAQPINAGSFNVVVSNFVGSVTSSVASLTVTNEIIIYHPDMAFSGSWMIGTNAAGRYARSYAYASTTNGAPNSVVSFRPKIIQPGRYNVYIWYSQGSDRSTNAQLTILGAGSSLFTNVNQTTGGGNWRLIASARNFAAGTNGFVRLANNTGETNKVVMADAMRFVYLAPPKVGLLNLQPDGRFQMQFQGVANVDYTLETSTNLLHWVPLTNFTMPNGTFQFTDSPATNNQQRFYRIRW